jgi:hypothetical protein
MKAAWILILGMLVLSVSTYGQSPSTGQWTIVASNETNLNTVDGSPLQFITDWTVTDGDKKTTVAPVLANTFTNSGCSASGQPADFTVRVTIIHDHQELKDVSIMVTVDNGQVYKFRATQSGPSQFSGTFTSSGGGCTQADSGDFTATLYSPLNATFSGTIESFAGTNPVNMTMTLNTDANFNVSGSIQAPDKSCMADLTINGAAAQQYGPSFATGDVMLLFASDNNGNVVAFVVSATDQNGNLLNPPWPEQVYVTYYVVAGACSGDNGTDAPFRQVQSQPATNARISLPFQTPRTR